MRARLGKLVVLLLVVAGATGYWLWRAQEQALTMPLQLPDAGVLFTIESGAGFANVVSNLHQRAFLKNPLALTLHARWNGTANTIKAGEYRLQAGMTPLDALALFVSGRVVQRSLTIVEGMTFSQTMTAMRSNPELIQTLGNLSESDIMGRIGADGVPAEGRFFPETYFFPSGTTDLESLKRAFVAMQTYLENAWQRRAPNLPLASPEEALILASIVEKETGLAAERELIAGVFIRRLRKNMRLETDPTVIYGLGADFDGNLRKKDLKHDTPFNTYIHRGLPPTPIALPGAAAIDAVLHPADGTALFFVAKGDGSHHFSSTYAEHQRAVNLYQRNRRVRQIQSTQIPADAMASSEP